MPRIVTLTGPSGAGKSTVLEYLHEEMTSGRKPEVIAKYTTRAPRQEDLDRPEHLREIIPVDRLPEQCNLVYEQYGSRYGLEIQALEDSMKSNRIPLVIVNDVRVVEDLRTRFGEDLLSVFVFRKMPVFQEMLDLECERNIGEEQEDAWNAEIIRIVELMSKSEPSHVSLKDSRAAWRQASDFLFSSNVWRRIEKARAIFRIYIENLMSFDRVLLNFSTRRELRDQVKLLASSLANEQGLQTRDRRRLLRTPRLFIVVGTPGSGKDVLIRGVADLGRQHAAVVQKHTSRSRRTSDGGELACPGDPGFDLETCDIRYTNYKDEYGIKSERIWNGLREGVSQVAVVSNEKAIAELIRCFGSTAMLVYVHSQMTAEDYAANELAAGYDSDYVERRRVGYEMAQDMIIRRFLEFEHVLIHAGRDEDLFDQIFRLFREYERSILR